jgi:hypothetical protein
MSKYSKPLIYIEGNLFKLSMIKIHKINQTLKYIKNICKMVDSEL